MFELKDSGSEKITLHMSGPIFAFLGLIYLRDENWMGAALIPLGLIMTSISIRTFVRFIKRRFKDGN